MWTHIELNHQFSIGLLIGVMTEEKRLTVQDSAEEQPHVEQSMRSWRGFETPAGLATTNAARMAMSVIESFMLIDS